MNEILSNFEKLILLSKEKEKFDKKHIWSEGSKTFTEELKKEIEEVIVEYNNEKQIYLEDELGDVLWDYLNLLVNLEVENKIDLKRVFTRANKKFSQRVSGINYNSNWNEIKKKQKEELKIEQEMFEKSKIKN